MKQLVFYFTNNVRDIYKLGFGCQTREVGYGASECFFDRDPLKMWMYSTKKIICILYCPFFMPSTNAFIILKICVKIAFES